MPASTDQLQHDLGLMLMYLSSWTERNSDARRFWKGFDFGLLDLLADEGLIESTRGAKSAYLTEAGEQQARALLARYADIADAKPDSEAAPAIVRLYAGDDGQSHFEEIKPNLEPRGDQSEIAELVPGSGILVRRFEANRTNPWHHAPGRYAVFTLCGAVDIRIGDGTTLRIGPGDILIAEDLEGQGHETREAGPKPRVSVFVPLQA
jgi:hypothetical protein